MRYLLLIGGGGDDATESDPPDASLSSREICSSAEAVGWVEEMTRRGVFQSGEVLRPPSDATTVRVRDGEVLLSDGPFAETKEQVGGVCVIECADLDEAVEVAAAHPVARFGTIEVRPVDQT